MKRRASPLERFLGRLDDLDSVNLANLVQRLARERRLLETVFNTIKDGILVIDENGIIQYANTVALRMAGIPKEQVGDLVLWKLLPDLMHAFHAGFPHWESDFENRVVSQEVELTYPDRRHVRLYMVPLNESMDAAEQRAFLVVLSDVTEEKTTTEELIENERVASIMNLAAGVAHELGNPLNSLDIHLQLMQRQLDHLGDSPERAKLTSQLGICRGEVERLDGIISNFLEAVRPRPPDLGRELDLHEVLAEVLKVQEGELESKGMQVDVEVSHQLPQVSADRNQIKQVLFNVIKNAVEASESSGRIEIRTRSDDDSVYMELRDHGVGISQEELPNVFLPYYTTKEGGHGLGMMIVQRIMRDHGGQIGIDSIPGRGTTVILRFPRKDRRSRLLEGPRVSGSSGDEGNHGNQDPALRRRSSQRS